MLKVAAAGLAALFISVSPSALAEDLSSKMSKHMSAADPASLTNLRIEAVKAALQLTPAQGKYWPSIEEAIRTRATHRMDRIEKFADRASEMQDYHPVELALNSNPVEFMQRRADALAQRSTDLRKLADAWKPLYETLSPDQKWRMALLRMVVLREVINRVDRAEGQLFDHDEEE
jgi:LTXXQ motif family protein